MSQSQIESLRKQIDGLNLQILDLLNQRGRVASEIGKLQSDAGSSQYDPKRELEMLQVLTDANEGPFGDATIKSLFKSIFQASMVTSQAAEKPKFLTSRGDREDTVVMVGDVPVGGDNPPALIAGPCAIESKEQIDVTAEYAASLGVKLFRGGAFKPRSNPYSFQGLGEPALQWAREACDKHGMKFVAEIMDARDLELCLDYVDVLQIGARNSQNFTLLKAVGKTDRAVLLKRGLSSTIDEWIMSAEYVMSEGNHNVMLCERGIRKPICLSGWTRPTLAGGVIY